MELILTNFCLINLPLPIVRQSAAKLLKIARVCINSNGESGDKVCIHVSVVITHKQSLLILPKNVPSPEIQTLLIYEGL